MRFLPGNKKLGKNMVVINRPVGDTCPRTCPLHPQALGPLGNKCYMIRLEGLRPNIRKAAMKNLEVDPHDLFVGLMDAAHENRLVRLHVGGDFALPDGQFDRAYLAAWFAALGSLPDLPKMLAYTHCLDPLLAQGFKIFDEHFKLFASVHGPEDLAEAETAGFTRFALTMEEKHYEHTGGSWIERFGKRFLVCPEQRGKIKDCDSCRYCWRDWKHGGNVAFLEHSQPPRGNNKK